MINPNYNLWLENDESIKEKIRFKSGFIKDDDDNNKIKNSVKNNDKEKDESNPNN